ncbi:hypothetical protein TGVAND_439060, partial [Toxoplasma gondii VAND]
PAAAVDVNRGKPQARAPQLLARVPRL